MGSHPRLSEVDGGPFEEDDLILVNHLERIVRKHGGEPAVISCHQPANLFPEFQKFTADRYHCLRWTHSELWHYAELFGKALLAHGFSTDTKLAVLLRNQAEYPLAVWAALRLGVAFVPMHPKLTDSPVELKHELSVTRPGAVIVADLETARKLEEVAPAEMESVNLKIIADVNASKEVQWLGLQDMLKKDLTGIQLPQEHSPNDVEFFYFTGGTTSLPKPASMTTRAGIGFTTSLVNGWHVTPGRRIVGHLPTFHSYANVAWVAFWLGGGCVVFPAPAYSPGATLEAIEKERCTDMPGNPAMIDSLVNHPAATTLDLSSLFHVNLGGSVVHPNAFEKCKAPPLSVEVTSSSFGMSEAGLLSTWDIHERQPDYKDCVSVGKIVPGCKAKICAHGSKEPISFGETGELHFGSPYIYANFPGRDESYLYREGDTYWVITGDQACFGKDEELYILGRYKDLIIRGGRNISPAAIETIINTLPGVLALVVGLPDEVAGEVPVAVLQYSGDVEPPDKDIRSTVSDALGQHCSPQRMIRLRELGLEQFPLTAAGKQDKKRLGALVKDYCAKSNKDEPSANRNGVTNGTTTTPEVLAGIWAQLSAQSPDDISSKQPVTSFADSLVILQATSLIEKRTQKSISPEDILVHPTIEQQARLLDRRSPKSAEIEIKSSSRDGPPSASEMVHVRNNQQRFDETKTLVSTALPGFGLDWQDVEDVLPYYDTGRFMLDFARRSQSWNIRMALAANVTVDIMQKAVVESLRAHPLFRSIAVKFDDDTYLHVLLRHSRKLMDQTITTSREAITEAELPMYRLNDSDFDYASSSGLLFQITLLPLAGGSSCGLVINSNHSMYDALSTSLWLDDLNACLKAESRPVRIPYKLFADAYYLGRNGTVAQNSVDFFKRKLQGCGSDKRSQWPPQRQPGWMLGAPVGWTDEDGAIKEPSTRSFVDPEGERYGQQGFMVDVTVTDELQQQHNVSPVALFKTAVTIFNVHKTSADYALFHHWEAARKFPFLDDNHAYASMLPNPMDLNGPTGQRVVDKISLSPKDNILALLCRIQEDVTATSRHSHAPLYEVKKALVSNPDSPTARLDAEVFYETLHRQVFNWVPQVPALSNADSAISVRRVQWLPRADLGFVWTGRRTDKDHVNFITWWDDGQMGWREAKAALAEVAGCVKWMMDAKNWQRDVEAWFRDCKDKTNAAERDVRLS